MSYARPRTVEDAIAVMSEHDVQVLAGATDIYPSAVGRTITRGILDLSAVSTLRGIERCEDFWRVGACTTWSEVATTPLPEQFRALQHAAKLIGGPQVQNRGTIGGNLCTASPAGDGIPVLFAMSASVELASPSGTRVVRVEDFITGYRSVALEPGELLTAIRIPARSGPSDFQKLGSRSHLVISIAMVATHIETSPEPKVRIAVGACAPRAQRLRALEAQINQNLDSSLAVTYDYSELHPIDDVRATANYRRKVVGKLVARSIESCLRAL